MRRVIEHLESFNGIRFERTVEDEETSKIELALHVISMDLVNLSENIYELSTKTPQTSRHWFERAAKRKATMDELCWNDGQGMYFDYDTKLRKQARYESVTSLWPLWAGSASEEQALKLV